MDDRRGNIADLCLGVQIEAKGADVSIEALCSRVGPITKLPFGGIRWKRIEAKRVVFRTNQNFVVVRDSKLGALETLRVNILIVDKIWNERELTHTGLLPGAADDETFTTSQVVR